MATRFTSPLAAPAAAAQLPEAVLPYILQLVPQRERLTSCALVCQAWAAAAAAMTSIVEVKLKSNAHCRQLQDWMGKHAGVLTGLTVDGPYLPYKYQQLPPLLQLPVLKLLHSLNLSRVQVQLHVLGVDAAAEAAEPSAAERQLQQQQLQAAAAAAAAAGAPFIAAVRFSGGLPGYIFKTASKGLGYYQDAGPFSTPAAAAAAAAEEAPAAAPAAGVTSDASGGWVGSSVSGAGSSASSSAGTCVVLPQLQELRLATCHLTVQLAAQLLSATSLTHLDWGVVELWGDNRAGQQLLKQEQVFSTLWQQLQLLPKLSSLQLQDPGLPAESFTPVSSLQHLQHCRVASSKASIVAAAAAAVPAGLTSLHLAVWGAEEEDSGAAPLAEVCLTRLSKLRRFGGDALRMRPSTLGCMTDLRDLNLANPNNPDGSDWNPIELLAALQQLTQLQHLRLLGCQLLTVQLHPEQQWDGYQCFSALTASSQLTALHLVEPCVAPIPAAAFDHMFPTGRVLQSLIVLRLEGSSFFGPCVGAAQVARIAASCPALQELKLQGVTDAAFDTSCLLQLPPAVTCVKGIGWARHAR